MRHLGGADRFACTGDECDFVHWGNYSIGVGALVVRDGKILLVRRAIQPGKGNWTNPGGYIEQHEPIAETIVREVFEESGIRAAVREIVAVRDQPRDVHNIYIAFLMDYIEGEPIADGLEADGAGFYSPEEMEGMPVASFTKWLVNIAWKHTAAVTGLKPDHAPLAPVNGTGFAAIY